MSNIVTQRIPMLIVLRMTTTLTCLMHPSLVFRTYYCKCRTTLSFEDFKNVWSSLEYQIIVWHKGKLSLREVVPIFDVHVLVSTDCPWSFTWSLLLIFSPGAKNMYVTLGLSLCNYIKSKLVYQLSTFSTIPSKV